MNVQTQAQAPRPVRTDVEAQQIRLFQQVLIAFTIAPVLNAPMLLMLIPWPVNVFLVITEMVGCGITLTALFQLRRVGLRLALHTATWGILVILGAILMALGLHTSTPFLIVLFVPLVWAAMLGGTYMIGGVVAACGVIVGLAALETSNIPGIGIIHMPALPASVTVISFVIIVSVVGWFLFQSGQTMRTALIQGGLRERELEALRDSLEATVATRTALLEQRNAEQQRLLDLVAILETPTITVADGVLLAPIVGALDSRRAQALTSRLLQAASAQRAQEVILDIAGVTAVDTQVAQALLQSAQALRLLGCAVTITGISAEVATTLTHLGIALEEVTTARSPQEVLANSDKRLERIAEPKI